MGFTVPNYPQTPFSAYRTLSTLIRRELVGCSSASFKHVPHKEHFPHFTRAIHPLLSFALTVSRDLILCLFPKGLSQYIKCPLHVAQGHPRSLTTALQALAHVNSLSQSHASSLPRACFAPGLCCCSWQCRKPDRSFDWLCHDLRLWLRCHKCPEPRHQHESATARAGKIKSRSCYTLAVVINAERILELGTAGWRIHRRVPAVPVQGYAVRGQYC